MNGFVIYKLAFSIYQESKNGKLNIISCLVYFNWVSFFLRLIWFEGAQLYLQATGDKATLKEVLLPRAFRCMDYMLSAACYDAAKGFTPTGLGVVVDWGYVKESLNIQCSEICTLRNEHLHTET